MNKHERKNLRRHSGHEKWEPCGADCPYPAWREQWDQAHADAPYLIPDDGITDANAVDKAVRGERVRLTAHEMREVARRLGF